MQDEGVRKQGSSMRIIAQSQQDQIKATPLTTKVFYDIPLVGLRGCSRGQGCVNSKNLFMRNVQGCKKGFPGH